MIVYSGTLWPNSLESVFVIAIALQQRARLP